MQLLRTRTSERLYRFMTPRKLRRAVVVAALAVVVALLPGAPQAGASPSPHGSGRPDLSVTSPTSGVPAVAQAGTAVALSFEANRAWPYEIEVAAAGTEQWQGLADPAAMGVAEAGDNTIEMQVPAEFEAGDYDLRVRLFTPGRGARVERARDTVAIALQVTPADPPTTGFESRDGSRYTTHAEELDFLAEVAALSPRVTVTQEGESVEGRPLDLVRVGYPQPPPDAAVAEGDSMLVIGSQHGNEPAGREMALQLLRDLAFTADDALLDQLGSMTLLVIPSANPDGREADTRANATGVDLNRDHLHVTTPEGRLIGQVLRDFTPEVTVDAHEGPSTPNNPDVDPRVELSWPRNLNVDAGVHDLSRQLVEDRVIPRIEAQGYDAGIYGSPGGAGGGDERIGRNVIGLRHSVGMLVELFNGTPRTRVDLYLRTIHEVLGFQRERADEISTTVAKAPDRRADDGAARAPFYLGGSDWESPAESDILDPAPCGYLINTHQSQLLDQQAALFPFQRDEVSEEGVFVTMAQPLMAVVPLLLDERASFNLVDGIALDDCSDPGSVDPPEPPPPPTPPGQAATDLSDQDVGEPPRGWSMRWRSSDWTVLDDPRRVRHVVGGSSGRRSLTWDEVGDDGHVQGDVELYGVVRSSPTGNTLFQLPLHVSGETGNESAYYVDLRVDQSALRINRYADGSFTSIGRYDGVVPQRDTWYRVRLRREGDQLMARIWQDGEAEPDEWQAVATDNTHHGGGVGFAGFQANTVNDWAYLGVGTGGEPAPAAPADLLDGSS